MVFAVSIGKEIPTEDRVVCRPGSLSDSIRLVHGVKVICQSAELSLEEQRDR